MRSHRQRVNVYKMTFQLHVPVIWLQIVHTHHTTGPIFFFFCYFVKLDHVWLRRCGEPGNNRNLHQKLIISAFRIEGEIVVADEYNTLYNSAQHPQMYSFEIEGYFNRSFNTHFCHTCCHSFANSNFMLFFPFSICLCAERTLMMIASKTWFLSQFSLRFVGGVRHVSSCFVLLQSKMIWFVIVSRFTNVLYPRAHSHAALLNASTHVFIVIPFERRNEKNKEN